MDFEWDEAKNASNRRKHGIDFSIAGKLNWDAAEYYDDLDHDGENRYVVFAHASDGLGYVLVITFRDPDVTRIISARRFTRREYTTHGYKG